MRRAVVTVAVLQAAVGLNLAMAIGPAAAATTVTVDIGASNYLSRLVALRPAVRGVEIAVIELGNRLRLVNRTGLEVVVLGYEDEPYLRVGPEGVYENRRSPATYLNRDRQATVPVPEDADPAVAPEWRRVSDGPEARWYDHRIHWMGAIDPPAVRREPGARHAVFPEWTVGLRHGDTSLQAVGELVWVPGPSAWPWLLLVAVPIGAALLLLGAGLWAGSTSWWPGVLAAGVGVLVAVDATAALGRAWSSPGGATERVTALAVARPFLVLAWLLGAGSVVLLLRRRPAGLYPAAVAALAIGLLGGAAGLSQLSRSQIPSALPDAVARVAVAWSLGLGLAVAAACLLAGRRAHPAVPVTAPLPSHDR